VDDLIIPEHALKGMRTDSITEDDVYTVVDDHDEKLERLTDGRTEYGRMMEDGRWFVVVIENDGETLVSAWWDRRRGRRQRR
jgi:hypothetical protein